MRISLVTLGDPATLTGGYLYHLRMAEAAPARRSSVSFVSFPAWPFPLPAAAGRRVTRRLIKQRPDVVVLDSIAAAYAAPWLWTFPRPLAAMVHQRPGGIDHRRLRRMAQSRLDLVAYRRCERLLVASETLIAEMTDHGLDENRITVVPPGHNLVAESGSGLELRRGRRAALLCIGNWVERKGIMELLEAVMTLPESLCTLHLVGDEERQPTYARKVRMLLDNARLVDRVYRHGQVSSERVALMYGSADVFVLPSVREPYGTVYAEAMAAGLPVVGWRAGNLPHLARDGIDGFAVEPGDIRGLATALRTLCEDHHLRAAMSTSAKLRAESFPTWEDSADLFFSELRIVAEGSSSK